MKSAAIVGGGLAKFGRRRATLRDLTSEAFKALFNDIPNLSPSDVEALIVSSNAPERAGQTNLASVVAELVELRNLKYVMRTEIACSSGHAAIRSAWFAIASGFVDVALVIGVEKMWLPYPEAMLITDLERDWDFPHFWHGRAPSAFALCAVEHMRKYGTKREQLALVSVKNHGYARLNPYAQELRQRPSSVEDVLKSRPVSSPLNLFDCSSRVDGAAAVLLTSVERARDFTDSPIYLLGSGQTSIGLSLSSMGSFAEWPALREAAAQAYRMAGVEPKDIDYAELHDCFTISEIIEYEELGFCPKGEGGKFIEEGQSYVGGRVAVNTRGGLIGCGHPVGATGVAQAIEAMHQLRGSAEGRQVKDCRVALIHTLGGAATTHSVLILGGEPR